jgi:glycosyltransferase involved in cell wall biosynthesis
MRHRRVAVVASEILGAPGAGGPATADSFLAIALGRHGHDVELLVAPGRDLSRLSPEWEDAFAAANVAVRPLVESAPPVSPAFLAPSAHVHAALRTNPPDVVVADDWRALAYSALRSRQLGMSLAETAFVLYCHGPARVFAAAARKVPDTVARFGEEVAQRACVELADAIVSPSKWLLEWLRQHRWPPPARAEVIQNLWESAALGGSVTRAAGGRIRRLAFFGQLREGKGLGIFLAALRQLELDSLDGLEVVFLGHSRRWTHVRIAEELGPDVVGQLASLRVETQLDRTAALEELRRPGTLAVMPSLLENSPYAVAECIEHGIPFLAADVGGTRELVADEDRPRVLRPPTADDFARALADALASPTGAVTARPARTPQDSLAAWMELIETIEPTTLARHPDRAEADWVVLGDADDALVDALSAAQAATGADVVTTAVRTADGVRLFLGSPGALGLVENHYGTVGLIRRSLLTADVVSDAPWVLFARLALRGARIVSIPTPLADQNVGRATAGERLAVLEAFEAAPPGALTDLPQLSATLAAALERAEADGAAPSPERSRIRRALRLRSSP